MDARLDRLSLDDIKCDKDLKSTLDLVDAYNGEQVPETSDFLLEWLGTYNDAYTGQRDGKKTDTAFEYAELSRVKYTKRQRERELLRRILPALSAGLSAEMDFEMKVTCAILRVLFCIDVEVYRPNPKALIQLAKKLHDALENVPCSGATFDECEPILLSMHQIFILIARVACDDAARKLLQKLQKDVQIRLDEMKASSCYRFKYRGMMIEQCVLRLEADNTWARVLHQLLIGITAFLHVWHGLRGLAVLDINPRDTNEAFNFLQSARKTALPARKKDWYEELVRLHAYSLLVVRDPNNLHCFRECCAGVLEMKTKTRFSEEDRKVVRFGVIVELQLLVSLSEGTEVREWSAEQLKKLLCAEVTNRQRPTDCEAFEATLKTFHRAFKRHDNCPVVKAALEDMIQAEEFSGYREIVGEWMGGADLNAKLEEDLEEVEADFTWLFQEAADILQSELASVRSAGSRAEGVL